MTEEPTSRAQRGHLWVGTSGWVYPDWIGGVYPASLKKSADTLAFYARHFDTVELNSTFYHFPRQSTVEKWKALGGERFTWAVKGWRWISHIKRLKGVKKDLADFLKRISPLLAEKGVVLFQLPPSFKQDLKRLERFLTLCPKGIRVAMEFRHPSWFTQTTYDLLKQFDIALVGVDAPGIPRVLEVRTAPFSYFRFHGSSEWYRHNYSLGELSEFARVACGHLKRRDVYAYFDNTACGYAFQNALEFRKMVEKGGGI
jgi:uncharacterized protein YecE (DUF72 family)